MVCVLFMLIPRTAISFPENHITILSMTILSFPTTNRN